jgi:TetR/AcrR family transcriptional regulator
MASLDETRREKIMEAAVATFARYGYRRTSMDALAEAVGMSRPALYQYFRNKEAVFRELTRWELDRRAAEAEAAARAASTATEGIEAILDAVLALHEPGLGSGHFYELIDEVQSRAGDLWAQYEKRILGAISARLAELVQERGVLPSGMGMDDVAAVLLYGAKGISLAPCDTDQQRTYVRHFAAMALRGLMTF